MNSDITDETVTPSDNSESTDPRAAASRRFLIIDDRKICSSIAELRCSLPPELASIAAAFEQNIAAVAATVGIPWTLAYAAAIDRHWQRIHSASRIRSLMLDQDTEETPEQLSSRRATVALDRARDEMREFLKTAEGNTLIVEASCSFLQIAIRSENTSRATDELLRQGVVLAWSALEVLTRDLFESLLNATPQLALAILDDPTGKQRIPTKFTLDEIASAGFDLSKSIGALLTRQQDFSDLRTIKSVMLPVLRRHPAACSALESRTLWDLCQQRHLIVHRRGIVDAQYKDSTGAPLDRGERLPITPADLENQIQSVLAAGHAFLSAAAEPLK